ncbi:unnamed protein product [Fraxinus pennsylvanica]|uniref:Uncharacterized protein n=1 Tax=Fraxinus pennsylvanica TaxID=56036 RepID=A0AAD1YV03_9LAMI|nr:unnamed protein product [Fraxinus pennsylvanica]
MTLGNLRDLEILHLAYNPLTNDPSMLELDFLIPLKNCRQLRIIRIGNNSFDGMLPKAIGNLSSSLETFYAYYCGIKGMIPNEIGNMTNLIALDLGGNELIGTIPHTLGQLRMAQVLQIDGNKLQGPIPVTFCNLTNLYVLKLKENNLSEQIPSCFGNLTSLREIHLSYNSLTSIIPSTLWTNKDV